MRVTEVMHPPALPSPHLWATDQKTEAENYQKYLPLTMDRLLSHPFTSLKLLYQLSKKCNSLA